MNNIENVLEERGTNYGEFLHHAELSQYLKTVFTAHIKTYGQLEKFTPDMKEAIGMIFHKIARIANGDPTHIDGWVDIGGYSQLVAKRLTDKTKGV